MPKKVAIVGAAESRKTAPFTDLSWDIWSCNNLYPVIPRRTRWFEMHNIYFDGVDYYRKGEKEFRGIKVNNYLDDLGNLGCEIYMQKPCPKISLSLAYPTKTISGLFHKYLTSTPAYMLALALVEDFQEIGLFGINMAMDDEYHRQKPCLEYLIGIAEGQERMVVIPEGSGLLFSPQLYGYDFHKIEFVKEKIKAQFFQ